MELTCLYLPWGDEEKKAVGERGAKKNLKEKGVSCFGLIWEWSFLQGEDQCILKEFIYRTFALTKLTAERCCSIKNLLPFENLF